MRLQEGVLPIFKKPNHFDCRNHKTGRERGKHTLNGWQLYSPTGKQDLPMSLLRAALDTLVKQVVSNQIARGEGVLK